MSLATSRDWLNDGMCLMMDLHGLLFKKSVKFHDGTDFTAKDVKWTIDTIKIPIQVPLFRADLDAIKEVEIVDQSYY